MKLPGGIATDNRRGQDGRASIVDDTTEQVAVSDGERQSAAPEHFARPFPSTQGIVHETVAEVIGRMYDKVRIESVANVVIRAAIIARPEALGALLALRNLVGIKAIREDAAVGDFIQVVRPGVVRVGGKPLGEVAPEADGQAVVVRDGATQHLGDVPIVRYWGRVKAWECTRRPDPIRVVGVVKAVRVGNANTVIPHVVHNQHGRRIDFLLELQIPLLPPRGVNGSSESCETGRREGHPKWAPRNSRSGCRSRHW